ncbi:YlxR family protein [Gracilibacillus oryzae]|uniref:YlxR family protein n=1 Tax=Gracilibacillus oryzae TaxID=1672701 RepID=A0A7C8L5P2_9BACI|nr:YlxR family protein [Gracilibacillus oryzae]KAB8138776.1 YlxR family protein [Gracilibacillus oryzae]
MSKQRKVPLRKCVVTQEMVAKKSLIRVVKTKEGEVFVDPTGKKNGRGAYVTRDVDVIKKAELSRALDRQLDIAVPSEIYQQLIAEVEGK